MMKSISEEKFGRNGHIYYRKINIFKTSNIVINYKMKFEKKKIAALNLLCKYLGNCSNEYKTISEFNKAFDNLYGSNLYINFDYDGDLINLYFGINFVDYKYVNDESLLEGAIKLLHADIYNPLINDNKFDNDILEICRGVCISNTKRKNELNMAYVNRKLYRQLFKRNSVFNVNLTKEKMLNVTEKDLLAIYNEIINSNFDIIVAGNINKSKTSKLLRKYFKYSNFKKEKFNPIVRVNEKDYEPIIVKKDVNQAKVAIAYKLDVVISDDDFIAAKIANSCLCGFLTSKIYYHLREKLGLCYSIRSSYLSLNGLVIFNTAVANENVSKVVEEINNQIIDASNGNLSDEVFNQAKTLAINRLEALSESKQDIVNLNLFYKDSNVSLTLEKEIEKINALTKKEVIDVFSKYKYMTYVALTR